MNRVIITLSRRVNELNVLNAVIIDRGSGVVRLSEVAIQYVGLLRLRLRDVEVMCTIDHARMICS